MPAAREFHRHERVLRRKALAQRAERSSIVQRTVHRKNTPRWIGLRPSQLDLLALPRAAKVPLTARDRARAKSLRDSPWAAANDPEFAAELDEQLFLGYKVELEALQSLGFDFLSNEWLAERIDARDYI